MEPGPLEREEPEEPMSRHAILDVPIYIEFTLKHSGTRLYLDPTRIIGFEESTEPEGGCRVLFNGEGGSEWIKESVDEAFALAVEGAKWRSEASLEALCQVIAREVRKDEHKKANVN